MKQVKHSTGPPATRPRPWKTVLTSTSHQLHSSRKYCSTSRAQANDQIGSQVAGSSPSSGYSAQSVGYGRSMTTFFMTRVELSRRTPGRVDRTSSSSWA
jgi:hypothetical protein